MTRKQLLIALSELLSIELSKLKLDLFLETLSDLSNNEFNLGYKTLVNTFSFGRFPTPAEFRCAAKPVLDPKAEAIRRLNLIKEAVRKFGWAEPGKAENYLGTIIWIDVERMGGWQHICESKNCNLHDSMAYAQQRDGIASSVKALRDGIDYTSHALKDGSSKLLIPFTLKTIE